MATVCRTRFLFVSFVERNGLDVPLCDYRYYLSSNLKIGAPLGDDARIYAVTIESLFFELYSEQSNPYEYI